MKTKKNWEKCDICGKKEVDKIESLNYWRIDNHICWCKSYWKIHEKANEVFDQKYKESKKEAE